MKYYLAAIVLTVINLCIAEELPVIIFTPNDITISSYSVAHNSNKEKREMTQAIYVSMFEMGELSASKDGVMQHRMGTKKLQNDDDYQKTYKGLCNFIKGHMAHLDEYSHKKSEVGTIEYYFSFSMGKIAGAQVTFVVPVSKEYFESQNVEIWGKISMYLK